MNERAFRKLITLGAIGDVLASPSFDPQDGIYGFGDVAAIINEVGPSNAGVYSGLAKAVTGKGQSVRRHAIDICTRISPPPPILLEALVAALADKVPAVRKHAAIALGEIKDAAPFVLSGLATALPDSDLHVRSEVMQAIAVVGVPSQEILAGLARLLGDVASPSCGMALYVLKSLGSFNAAVAEAVRQVATSKASTSDRQHQQNCQQAAELLTQISLKPLVQDAVKAASEPLVLSDEDKRILSWFEKVNLTEYRTPLQVFWCIGRVEKEAMASAGSALGWHSLAARLKTLKPKYKLATLPTGATSLCTTCIPNLDGLFDREPFHSHAWSEAERKLELRTERMHGQRHESRWTIKAWKAWGYVDRFLTIEGVLPTIVE